jgi:ribosomal protein L12E/L44/L45/RPP1/RPP2
MTVEFAYLDVIRKEIEIHTNTLLELRDKYNVVVDEERATNLIKALDHLKTAIETTPIIERT